MAEKILNFHYINGRTLTQLSRFYPPVSIRGKLAADPNKAAALTKLVSADYLVNAQGQPIYLSQMKKGALMPSAYYPELAVVPFVRYYRRKYRYVFLDIDNTLLTHGSIIATERAKEICTYIQEAGFKCILFSNAKASRLTKLAETLNLPAVFEARKPQKEQLLAYCQKAEIDPSTALVVGDQLMTDIWTGNRCGIHTIWLDPISKKEVWYIKPKRLIERLLKSFYKINGHFDLILLEKRQDMR